jgi:hypothetical protein
VSAGTGAQRLFSGRTGGHFHPWRGRAVAGKAENHCPPFDFTQGGELVEPRSEGLAPRSHTSHIVSK